MLGWLVSGCHVGEMVQGRRVASGVALQRGKGPAMQVFAGTQRLVLRRFTMAEVGNLADLDADPDVMNFITGGIPTPQLSLATGCASQLGARGMQPKGRAR